jgi:hypothetical protein
MDCRKFERTHIAGANLYVTSKGIGLPEIHRIGGETRPKKTPNSRGLFSRGAVHKDSVTEPSQS